MLETTLCYIFKEDQVLMLYRNKKENDVHEGKWNGLGGKVEPLETPLQCVSREVFEESGLKLINPTLIGACYYPNFNGMNEMMYVYIAKQFEGMIGECNEGELYWKLKDDIMTLNLWDSDRFFLPYVLNEKNFIGLFEYNNIKFIKGVCQEVDLLTLERFIKDKKRTV